MIRAKTAAAAVSAACAFIVAAVLIAACLSTAVQAQTAAPVHGRAYLFRGLIGLIDWGMDQLATRIDREGVAANINSHLMWHDIANQAISDYRRDPKPITVVGHSIGGDAAIEFAEALGAARVPVALLITYDPNRSAHSVPGNVERYINLYQSSNILGGGDIEPGHGFHGHFASYNLKDRPEIIHVNLDKFDRIQEILAGKIRSAAAGGGGEAVPLHIIVPPSVPIELWDSGVAVSAHAGDTLQSLAAANHVPLWAVTQINKVSETAALTEGQRVVIPRYLGQKVVVPNPAAPNPAAPSLSAPSLSAPSPAAPPPAASDAPAPAASSAPSPSAPSGAPAPAASPPASPAPPATTSDAPAGH
jgi:hypothetical protein